MFDIYRKESLKDLERQRRLNDDKPFIITGANQSPMTSPSKLLKNGCFKDALGQFLCREWKEQHYAAFLGEKQLYVSYGGDCTRIYVDAAGVILNDKPLSFQVIHEEADTLIPFHVAQISGNVLVRVTDTDVLETC